MSEVTPWVAALLRERAGYAARGLADRLAAVDEQLEAHGYTPEADEHDPQHSPHGAKTRGERMSRRGR
jgi:hypothetical protein